MIKIRLTLFTCLLLLFQIPAESQEVRSFGLFLGLSNQEITEALPQLAHYDLLIVDGTAASKANIESLQASGVKVLGYLSVGTIETGRPWFKLVKQYQLDFWPEWQEWYAEVSNQGFRSVVLKNVLPRMIRKNFDGVFLDNVDMIIEHPDQLAGMLTLVRQISLKLRRDGKLLYAQNGGRSIIQFAKYLDGWNQEGVNYEYSFDSEEYFVTSEKHQQKISNLASRLNNLGLNILFTSYWKDPDNQLTESARQFACDRASLAFISDIDLKTIANPITCQ